MEKIYRIRSYRDNLYIEAYEIEKVSKTGRFIASVPGCRCQGIKPARLNQFNSIDSYDFAILTGEEFLFRDLNFFLRRYKRVTGGSILVINFECELEEVSL